MHQYRHEDPGSDPVRNYIQTQAYDYYFEVIRSEIEKKFPGCSSQLSRISCDINFIGVGRTVYELIMGGGYYEVKFSFDNEQIPLSEPSRLEERITLLENDSIQKDQKISSFNQKISSLNQKISSLISSHSNMLQFLSQMTGDIKARADEELQNLINESASLG